MWLVVNLLVECPRGSSDLWLLGDEDFDDDDSEKECPEYVRRWGLFPSGALLAYASMVLVTFICDFLCQRNVSRECWVLFPPPFAVSHAGPNPNTVPRSATAGESHEGPANRHFHNGAPVFSESAGDF